MQFFPKTEKYVALYTNNDDQVVVDKRNRLREQIKANLVAAAASGKDLEGDDLSQTNKKKIIIHDVFFFFVIIYCCFC